MAIRRWGFIIIIAFAVNIFRVDNILRLGAIIIYGVGVRDFGLALLLILFLVLRRVVLIVFIFGTFVLGIIVFFGIGKVLAKLKFLDEVLDGPPKSFLVREQVFKRAHAPACLGFNFLAPCAHNTICRLGQSASGQNLARVKPDGFGKAGIVFGDFGFIKAASQSPRIERGHKIIAKARKVLPAKRLNTGLLHRFKDHTGRRCAWARLAMQDGVMQRNPKRQRVRFAARFGNHFGFRFGRQAWQHNLLAHSARHVPAKADLNLRLTRNSLGRRAKAAFEIIDGGLACGFLVHSFQSSLLRR